MFQAKPCGFQGKALVAAPGVEPVLWIFLGGGENRNARSCFDLFFVALAFAGGGGNESQQHTPDGAGQCRVSGAEREPPITRVQGLPVAEAYPVLELRHEGTVLHLVHGCVGDELAEATDIFARG